MTDIADLRRQLKNTRASLNRLDKKREQLVIKRALLLREIAQAVNMPHVNDR